MLSNELNYNHSEIVGKDNCSSAIELAKCIIEYYHNQINNRNKSAIEKNQQQPLLFLCGNRRRDELPSELAKSNIPYEELVVYQTEYNNERNQLLNSSPTASPWLVFFSPSGVESLEEIINNNHNNSENSNSNNHNNDNTINKSWITRAKIAAIGPTTASAIREILRVPSPQAIASKPNPLSLVEAIVQYDQQQKQTEDEDKR